MTVAFFVFWLQDCAEVSAAALVTISELFYRQISLPCAAIIAKGIKNLLEYPNLRKTNELYQDKLTELLKLFTTQHWNQWMNNHDDLHEIITALYHYTFTGKFRHGGGGSERKPLRFSPSQNVERQYGTFDV